MNLIQQIEQRIKELNDYGDERARYELEKIKQLAIAEQERIRRELDGYAFPDERGREVVKLARALEIIRGEKP